MPGVTLLHRSRWVVRRRRAEALERLTRITSFFVVLAHDKGSTLRAGIPLTACGVASQLTVVTGRSGDGWDIDYERLAGTSGTLVIFMDLARLEEIADNLILAGRPVDQPAAVISRLSLPGSEQRIGTLGTVAGLARGLTPPAVAVIGHVVARASQLEAVVAAARHEL
jgi:uroporphyrin-III C-methyltransferase